MRHFKNNIVLFITTFLFYFNVNGQSLNFKNTVPLKAANFQKKINDKNVK